MKNLVLYAPPAAGKGTQCELLKSKYNYKVLSIGQVLRNARDPQTEVGRAIIETQDKGILTPDNIVADALKLELEKYSNDAIIIEGYPRNINQARLLDNIFNDYIVINLKIDRDTAEKRTLGRLNCDNCGKIYNKFFVELAPKKDDICDVCGSILKTRSDDNEKSFKTRFDIYEINAPEILNYYHKKGILFPVDVTSPEEVFKNISSIIEDIKD